MGVESVANSFIAADPILGGIIVVLGAAVLYLFKARDKERDARLEESKEVTSLIVKPLQDLTQLITDSNNDVLDAIDQSNRRNDDEQPARRVRRSR